jgi:hypothetical protein
MKFSFEKELSQIGLDPFVAEKVRRLMAHYALAAAHDSTILREAEGIVEVESLLRKLQELTPGESDD